MELKKIYELAVGAEDYPEFLEFLATYLNIPNEYNNKQHYVEQVIEKKLNSA